MTRRLCAALLTAASAFTACGYKVGGQADLLPSTIHTIAIPAFSNNTTRYKLTEYLPSAIGREFNTRTRYRVIADPREADALLEGRVNNYYSSVSVFDQGTGRAAGVQLYVYLTLTLRERATGKVLYVRDNYEVRQRYEVSVDQRAYFDESEVALRRMSQEVARQVVSSVLEAF